MEQLHLLSLMPVKKQGRHSNSLVGQRTPEVPEGKVTTLTCLTSHICWSAVLGMDL